MDTHEQRHEMLQNVNSCGKVLTPSLKVTMLNNLVALKQKTLASKLFKVSEIQGSSEDILQLKQLLRRY